MNPYDHNPFVPKPAPQPVPMPVPDPWANERYKRGA